MKKQTHPHDTRSHPSRPNVRSGSMRKGGRDGGFTPTEQLKKNRLMKQFARSGRKGYEVSSGNSEAFRRNFDLIDWGHK